ncbi:MAG TPA: bacillithiol biosynthesis BshC, partial [Woeseiaceae bacterium]|nr:bacillithiol biosynthesis BshC [Woeseiaceae bacterium]
MNEQAAGMGPRASLRITASDYPGRRSRLCEDVVAGEGRISEFLGPRFDDATALGELISALHRRNYPRSGLAAILKEFACAVDAPSAVEEQIERLRNASAVTVFAGQQAGLFTGPLLTIYKALSVERWADDLERAFSVPVIACFWIADDDHDFAEIDHVEFPSGTAVERIRYEPSQAPSGAPVGRHRIDSGIEPVFARLEEQLPESEYKTGVLQTLKEAYAPGTGFGEAFARLWYRMFPASKLVFVSGSDERLKRLSAPVLATAAL